MDNRSPERAGGPSLEGPREPRTGANVLRGTPTQRDTLGPFSLVRGSPLDSVRPSRISSTYMACMACTSVAEWITAARATARSVADRSDLSEPDRVASRPYNADRALQWRAARMVPVDGGGITVDDQRRRCGFDIRAISQCLSAASDYGA